MKIPLTSVAIVGAVLAWFGYSSLSPGRLDQSIVPDTAAASPVQSSLTQLRQQGSTDSRVNAARFIASNATDVTPDLVHQLGQPLLKDHEVAIRKEVAAAMRQLAARHCQSELRPEQFEPQMLDILLTAFNREDDPGVRVSIVQAAGQLNHPDALQILDKAAEDTSPAVREAASKARNDRDRRLLAARTG